MSSAIVQWLRGVRRVARFGFVTLKSFRLNQPSESLHAVSLILLVRNHTLLDVSRLRLLYGLVRELDSQGIPGDFVECGVYRGGSAAVLAGANRKSVVRRNIWLFDSFQGLPAPGERDGSEACGTYREAWCAAEEGVVRELFTHLGLSKPDPQIVKGWFQDTLPGSSIQQIALLHIDADWYDSVTMCLTTLFDRVQPGGVIVLDDYGRWEGCRNATNDFLSARNLDPTLLKYCGPAAYFRKPASH